MSAGVTQGRVSVFLLDRFVVWIICGANLRVFWEGELNSIGCAKALSFDVMALGGWSCEFSSLIGFLECESVVSTDCGRTLCGLDPLASEERSFVAEARLVLAVCSMGCGKCLRGQGGKWGAMLCTFSTCQTADGNDVEEVSSIAKTLSDKHQGGSLLNWP